MYQPHSLAARLESLHCIALRQRNSSGRSKRSVTLSCACAHLSLLQVQNHRHRSAAGVVTASAASSSSPDSVIGSNAKAFGSADTVKEFITPLPADVEARLARIVSALPELGPSTRLLDVGSGTGCLIPHLQARGVADITAVDLSAAMLEQLTERFPAPSVCGNDPGETGITGAAVLGCSWTDLGCCC